MLHMTSHSAVLVHLSAIKPNYSWLWL